MVSRYENTSAALSAASRRFPERAREIGALIDRSESFRDMCDELAEADATLANIDRVSAAAREERALECRDWIERLTREIGDALNRSNVIPIVPAGKALR